MKILFIAVVYNYPGFDNMYADLIAEFRKSGHEICVACSCQKRENKPTRLCHENGIPVLRIRTGNLTGQVGLIEKGVASLTADFCFGKEIRKYYGKEHFDLVIHTTPPITLYKTIRSISKKSNAVVCHILKDIFPQTAVDLGAMTERHPMYRYYRHCEKAIYKMDDCVGCTSRRNAEYILAHNDISPEKIITVRNSITPRDRSMFLDDGELRRKLGMGENDTLFLFGGSLGVPQAIDFLTEFVLRLVKREDIYVAVLGNGTKAVQFCDRIKAENAGHITYHAFLPKEEYMRYLRACDVGMIFLDYRYNVPNNPLRFTAYMEAGLPMIAATDKVSDISEWIADYQLGYWVESREKNIDKLVEKAWYMADHPELRRRMGENARALLERDYLASETCRTITEKVAAIRAAGGK